MGAPLPSNAIMPMAWALKAERRDIQTEPGMERIDAYWIEELGAWIAGDDEEELMIRKAVGDAATILRGKDLKP